jgi:hypothetical protein
MMGCHQQGRAAIALCAPLCVVLAAQAAAPPTTTQSAGPGFRLEAIQSEPLPESVIHRLPLAGDAQGRLALLLSEDGKLVMALPDGRRFALPRRLPLLVSADTRTFVQFGDEKELAHPRRMNVFWLDDTGRQTGEVVNHFAGDSTLNLSADGFTAVAGRLLEDPSGGALEVFSPTGERLWDAPLGPRERVAQIEVSPKGEFATAFVTDAEALREDHRLVVWSEDGNRFEETAGPRILQKMVHFPAHERIFVQGKPEFGLFDVRAKRFLWKQRGTIVMVSPQAAALSPDGSTLVIAHAEIQGRRTGVYPWVIIALDAATGAELSRRRLEKPYAATWDPVFGPPRQDGVTLFAGDDRFELSWIEPQGGRDE